MCGQNDAESYVFCKYISIAFQLAKTYQRTQLLTSHSNSAFLMSYSVIFSLWETNYLINYFSFNEN